MRIAALKESGADENVIRFLPIPVPRRAVTFQVPTNVGDTAWAWIPGAVLAVSAQPLTARQIDSIKVGVRRIIGFFVRG
jgi:hypothetical protein